jgi:hypothetical protein
VIEKAHARREGKAERSWREYLWAGWSPMANLRQTVRQSYQAPRERPV